MVPYAKAHWQNAGIGDLDAACVPNAVDGFGAAEVGGAQSPPRVFRDGFQHA